MSWLRSSLRTATAAGLTLTVAAPALWPLSGRAQPGPFGNVPAGSRYDRSMDKAPREPAATTTLSPLVVRPMVPVPKVGQGATYFTPEVLLQAAHDARQNEIDQKYTSCGAGIGEETREDLGEFTLGALYDTLRVRNRQLTRLANAAAEATQAAMQTRMAAARGEGSQEAVNAAELSRQDKVRAYQAGNGAALEAEYRIADLQFAIETSPGWTQPEYRAYVDAQTERRSHTEGHDGIYVPAEYRDLRIAELVTERRPERGEDVIRVTGDIVNTRAESIAVPPVWLSLEDQFGTQVKSQQIVAPKGTDRIKPGASLKFTYALKPIPDSTANTVVTFAPQNHAPRLKPAGAYAECNVNNELPTRAVPVFAH